MVAREKILSLLQSYLGYSEEEAIKYVEKLEGKIKAQNEVK